MEYNYNEDEEYEGYKQLIKINIFRFEIKISYINSNKNFSYICISTFDDNNYHVKYINGLITDKVIEEDCIYDLNNDDFIGKIKNHMKKIDIYNSKSIMNINKYIKNNQVTTKLFKLGMYFKNNILLNKNIFCCVDTFNKNIFIANIWVYNYANISERQLDEEIEIIKLNNKYYEYTFLRDFIPDHLYIGQKYFYIENRDKIMVDTDKDLSKYKYVYLFDDIDVPLTFKNIESNLKHVISKYNNLTRYRFCLNILEETKYLLKIFD